MNNIPIALEAAHIKWHQAGGPDQEMNGIALCSLHHKLFDRGAFSLSRKFKILVSDHANGTTGFDDWLMKFHNKKISMPQSKNYYPLPDFINWHVKEVFKGYSRAL